VSRRRGTVPRTPRPVRGHPPAASLTVRDGGDVVIVEPDTPTGVAVVDVHSGPLEASLVARGKLVISTSTIVDTASANAFKD